MLQELSSRRISLATAAMAAIGLAAVVPHSTGPAAVPAPVHHQWTDVGANDLHLTNPLGRVGIGVNNPAEKLQVFTPGTAAIWARSTAAAGASYGVFAQSTSVAGTGVFGGASNRGVYGQAGGTEGRGVFGLATAAQGIHHGVWGQSAGSQGRGVYGLANAQQGATRGVVGEVFSSDPTAFGVMGIAPAPAVAMLALGNLRATGTKSFQIDHPLDPANRWLNHYCSEGPEPLNVHSGNTVLDETGSAWILLPDWFESINRDFRYHLTPIGAPGPDLHVAQEIASNSFLIQGGKPGSKVSWRVEAVRDDLYVQRYGAPIEVEKPAEARGRYMHPELHGLPREQGLDHVSMEDAESVDLRDPAAAPPTDESSPQW